MTFEEFYEGYTKVCAVFSEEIAAKWAWNAATLAERERCANICEERHWTWRWSDGTSGPKECADAIRNPSE